MPHFRCTHLWRKFFVFNFEIEKLAYNISLVSGVLYSADICIHYEMVTTISLVTICPQTKLLQCYWSYSLYYILYDLHCIFHRWGFHLYHVPTTSSLWQSPLCSLYLRVSFYFDLFACFHFLNSTCMWDHTIFVFLCLTYFIYHSIL